MEPITDAGKRARDIICSRWPDYANSIFTDTASWAIQPVNSGSHPSWEVNGFRLASAWNPAAEAQLQCAHLPDRCSNVTLFGIGAGHLPPLLLDRLQSGGTLQIVPLNAAVLIQMLDQVDMDGWLSHPAVDLVAPDAITSLPENLVITPAMLSLAEPRAELLRDQLRQWLSTDHMVGYQNSTAQLLEKNIAVNRERCLNDDDVAGLFDSQPFSSECIVIGAGPSLELAYPKIRQYIRNGASVVCVDAVLMPLLDAGIVPDVVVSIDPQPTIKRFFGSRTAIPETCSLVYFPVVEPSVLEMWPCRRWRAVSRDSRYHEFLQQCPTTALFSSGSVIHPALDIAVRSGAQTIYLAGVDFCYPFDSTHVQGVAVNSNRHEVFAEHISVRNYLGEQVASQMNFVSYYRDLERYVGWCVDKGRQFFNLGHHSARIDNVSWIPL